MEWIYSIKRFILQYAYVRLFIPHNSFNNLNSERSSSSIINSIVYRRIDVFNWIITTTREEKIAIATKGLLLGHFSSNLVVLNLVPIDLGFGNR